MQVVHFDEYAPPIRDFMEREVIITLVIMSLVLIGSGMVLPTLLPTIMLLVVLSTLLGLNVELLGPWLPMPESTRIVAPSSQASLTPLLDSASLGFWSRISYRLARLSGHGGAGTPCCHAFRQHRDFTQCFFFKMANKIHLSSI